MYILMKMNKVNPSNLSYRPEIDGLRAIAVLSVIFYHAKIIISGRDWFEGGFIGVDIFFVISGYLITRIIFSEIQTTGTFSFLNFYERRARRILPMLFVVIFASMPFAWQNLLPSDFVEYAESILASLFFGSNFFFYFSTTEYGADSALLKPFLHTWSLGVEEQFYLFFPILAIIAYKYFYSNFLTILIGLSLLSLQFSELMVVKNSDLNFYLPFSRFWELAIGSILAYRELHYKHSNNGFASKSLPIFGLYLIVYSILFFDSKTPHPSFHTLIPIIGVALIIGFASKDELVGKLLASKPFVWVGLVSYSAYLWHFPIFAFYRIGLIENDMRSEDIFSAISLTLLLSVLSYRFIEQPFRKKVSAKIFIFTVCISFFLIILMTSYVIVSKGFATKYRIGFDSDIISSANPSYLYGDKGCDRKDAIYLNKTQFCVFGDASKSEVDFLLLGDSHAMHAQPLLNKISNKYGMKGIFGGSSGCLPLLGIYPSRGSPHPSDDSKRCYGFNQNGYEFVKINNLKTVFLVARWDYYVDGANTGQLNNISDLSFEFGDINKTRKLYKTAVKKTFDAYKALGVRIVVVLQVPHQKRNVKRFLEKLMTIKEVEDRDAMFGKALNQGVSLKNHLQRQKIASSAWKELLTELNKDHLIIIDPTEAFCDAQKCPFVTEDYAIYTDYDHASERGYDRLEASFIKSFGFD